MRLRSGDSRRAGQILVPGQQGADVVVVVVHLGRVVRLDCGRADGRGQDDGGDGNDELHHVSSLSC